MKLLFELDVEPDEIANVIEILNLIRYEAKLLLWRYQLSV